MVFNNIIVCIFGIVRLNTNQTAYFIMCIMLMQSSHHITNNNSLWCIFNTFQHYIKGSITIQTKKYWMSCIRSHIAGDIDDIHHIDFQKHLNNFKNCQFFSKVMTCSTRLNQSVNFTNQCFNKRQNIHVTFCLHQVDISKDKQWMSGWQSVSQSDHVFAKTLLRMFKLCENGCDAVFKTSYLYKANSPDTVWKMYSMKPLWCMPSGLLL